MFERAAQCRHRLIGCLPGPSRTITVEPVKVPETPRVDPGHPREVPAERPGAEPVREPVPMR